MNKEYFDYSNIKKIKEKLIFFDLGANVGEVTDKVLKHRSESIEIYAFEPVNNNFNILKKKYSDKKNVKLFNKAIWTEESTLNFSVGIKNKNTNSKLTKIINDLNYDKKKYNENYDVECVNLSNFVDEKSIDLKNSFSIVKMDIEGAEYPVLNKMIKEDNFINNINVLLIEFHKEPFKGQKNEILEKMKDMNVKVYVEHVPGVFKREL